MKQKTIVNDFNIEKINIKVLTVTPDQKFLFSLSQKKLTQWDIQKNNGFDKPYHEYRLSGTDLQDNSKRFIEISPDSNL